MVTKRDVLLNLVNREFMDRVQNNIHLAYFRDIYDHVVTMCQKLEAYQGLVAILESTYLAMLEIRVGEKANKMNAVQKTMATVATITLPISAVTGLMGMQVPVPYQAGVNGFNDLTPFYVICAGLVGFSLVLTIIFVRLKWV
jgi:magnesium transporter